MRSPSVLDLCAVAGEVVAWSVTLPRWYASSSLPAVLARVDALTARRRVASGWSARHSRALQLAERIAARTPRTQPTCLFRALVRFAVMRRRGLGVRFVMGVERACSERAHAWVEIDGAPFEDGLAPFHVTTFAYSSVA